MMGNTKKNRFGVTRAISLVLLLLASSAVLYSVYQMVAGHAAFSWAWLVALLPAGYGAYLFGACALEGRRSLAMDATPEAEAVG